MLGSHLLKSWASTQPSVSLSSGEAEYYGLVKASGIALGHQSLMHDLGMNVGVRVWTDSSAAMGICGRSGLGKLRHVQTHTLWVQERVKTGAIELRKVNGLVNPADLFTKHLQSRERIEQLITLFNCEYRDGRASSAPELRKAKGNGAVNVVQEASTNDEPNNQSPAHDPDVLPHAYSEKDLEEIFARAVVPPDDDVALEGRCICSRPDCERCFPPPAPEFGPPAGPAEVWMVDRREEEKKERLRKSEPLPRLQLSSRGAAEADDGIASPRARAVEAPAPPHARFCLPRGMVSASWTRYIRST